MKFEDARKYIKANKSVDGLKFDKATDITNMIDILNFEAEKEFEKRGKDDISEVSKLLSRIMTRKSFTFKDK